MINRRHSIAALGAFSTILTRAAFAQDVFPSRPVRLVVPYPPGQGADIFGRIVAESLSRNWTHGVVVDNKGGGGGVPGVMSVKLAPPDGYTLLVGGSQAMTVNPNIYSKMPYEPLKDFSAITGLYVAPLILVANPDSGISSLGELVAAARKSPGQLSYASAGTGTSQHMTAELFCHVANINMVHVPYRGSGPAMTDLLGGQIKIMLDGLASSLPHVISGKIRPLAVTTPQRVPQLPDVPTIAELGYPGFSGIGWAGLFMPAGAPASLVEKISADVQAVLKAPEMQKRIVDRGAIADPSSPRATTDFVRNDTAKWAEVARVANIRMD
ncbi:Bug family tripartite tricarboxylate transporter substrate binding protein [Variovorax sp. PBL-E5]|uniref:Bug family tripartite tricarboxylate transporter substrate binding protein n=1 Tax=Variovorax sp. PBL-E5 TaxID=434014 RepID=UPI0013163DD2|nr:tripartite tricarboxylate transporter substrate binding protein [Variovorax sp. PBL-E5]VTU45701.1 Argininosuccinate lyase [Variovorax sp. PBL-E5]